MRARSSARKSACTRRAAATSSPSARRSAGYLQPGRLRAALLSLWQGDVTKQPVKVGVVGGSGYTGVELLRLLAQHPHCELKAITSRQEAGQEVAGLFPNLRGKVRH